MVYTSSEKHRLFTSYFQVLSTWLRILSSIIARNMLRSMFILFGNKLLVVVFLYNISLVQLRSLTSLQNHYVLPNFSQIEPSSSSVQYRLELEGGWRDTVCHWYSIPMTVSILFLTLFSIRDFLPCTSISSDYVSMYSTIDNHDISYVIVTHASVFSI